jgi:hypothetical protein
MAEVLCVYRQVKILKKAAAAGKNKPSEAVAIISYDEKPGVQAIATTAPDLPPEPAARATFAREFEYKRHGTVSLLAGIDPISGKVHALVRDRHRSREFIAFLKFLDAAYPTRTAIKLILDNHPRTSSRRPEPGSRSNPPIASNSPSRPSMAPGSTSSRASSPNLLAPSCATSASHPNRNSRIASCKASVIDAGGEPRGRQGSRDARRPDDDSDADQGNSERRPPRGRLDLGA